MPKRAGPRAPHDEEAVSTPRPTVAVGAIVFDGDRVLLVRRGRPPAMGLWTVPGGKVELGESLAAAVEREVAEETGVAVACGPLVEVIERVTPTEGGVFHFVILDYLAQVRGDASPRAGDDADDVAWVSWSELAARPLTEGLLPVLTRARARIGAAG